MTTPEALVAFRGAMNRKGERTYFDVNAIEVGRSPAGVVSVTLNKGFTVLEATTSKRSPMRQRVHRSGRGGPACAGGKRGAVREGVPALRGRHVFGGRVAHPASQGYAAPAEDFLWNA